MFTTIYRGNSGMNQRTIRELRTAAGMTQKELAEAIGTTATTVHRWESDRAGISAKHLQALTVILGTPAAAIVLPDPKRETPPRNEP